MQASSPRTAVTAWMAPYRHGRTVLAGVRVCTRGLRAGPSLYASECARAEGGAHWWSCSGVRPSNLTYYMYTHTGPVLVATVWALAAMAGVNACPTSDAVSQPLDTPLFCSAAPSLAGHAQLPVLSHTVRTAKLLAHKQCGCRR